MKNLWPALSAIGTLLAVLYSIYHQDITRWRNRPKISIDWFEPKSPHLVPQMGASVETTGQQDYLKSYQGMFITLKLTNKGKQTAQDAEAQLTNVAKRIYSDTWEIQRNWIPIPLQWVPPLQSLFRMTAERDLIPERPYLFNLGSFSTARDGALLITYTTSPKSQRETFEPGEYCFEVSIFGIGVPTVRKYIYVTFEKFSGGATAESISNFVKKVEMKDAPPWPVDAT